MRTCLLHVVTNLRVQPPSHPPAGLSAHPLPAAPSAGMLNLILLTPFARELCLLHGWCGVDRHTLLQRLAGGPGAAVAVIVGGAAEAVLSQVRNEA